MTAAARVSFDAFEADGSPRVFVGMHHPPVVRGASLNDSYLIHRYGNAERAWLEGAFDKPLYCSAVLPPAHPRSEAEGCAS